MTKLIHLLTTLAPLLPLTSAQYYRGFNLAATNPSTGACKTEADWLWDFQKMLSLPGGFPYARVYASSDCDTLVNAIPAALSAGVKLLAGVWAEDNAHFEAEKAALLSAVQKYGSSWMLACSVGSEDLYRGDTDPNTLASQIYDVRGMLSANGAAGIEVGHVDTWTAWVDRSNDNVTVASDFIGVDGYPYFQDVSIESSASTFWDSINAVRNVVNEVHSGAWVWVTETGEPVSGPTMGAAVASVENAQTYWSEVACAAFEQVHIFWYVLQDWTASPSFGVLNSDGNTIYNLTC
ncbi:MAG: hypothetical protein M1834_008326 [Cirrosporium novae-zelandiae]|nr:MAG: hypothetical protein M1834_008326 [Cirrosporium novae-zelandiae]